MNEFLDELLGDYQNSSRLDWIELEVQSFSSEMIDGRIESIIMMIVGPWMNPR